MSGKGDEMSKQATGKALPIIVLALVAVVFIFILKLQKSPVEPRTPSVTPPIDYGPLIQTHTDQASRHNINALQSFELDINRIIKQHEHKLREAATNAAKEAADYKSCSAIVYYLAWDKVKKDNQTDSYLDSEIKPITEPAITAFAQDINRAVGDLDSDLKRSTLILAKDLAALGPNERRVPVAVDSEDLDYVDFDTSLRNLGFNAAGVGVAAVFDAVAVSKTKVTGLIWKKIAAIASRMFGKQVAKVGGSLALAGADGPLPTCDIIALGGLVWTGYDIYKGKKEFQRDLNVSLNNMLSDANANIHKQAVKHSKAMLKSYQEMQDTIGFQTAANLSGVRP